VFSLLAQPTCQQVIIGYFSFLMQKHECNHCL
jgi:hypothetical protein